MSAVENKQARLRCIELYNKCSLEWLETCYSNQLEWIELPGPGTPEGRRGNFAFYRSYAEQVIVFQGYKYAW